ncbi:hypothetical protein M427DRAFT_28156 [Gonapodya prolifera JEL478]|uniref:Uncharacterized protein n=1 Tax=Gonapodya prolifera (strain JEL478) TaxID=1344416 RepID=A0A139AUM1_GONPJ|nr:hypothetical protein M427DRAFT_28156 [Gonapodya prolifera JEL478]|eukprot:KXS20431.1 hypothetical protein M427DRAFT_28156 [Gonapodya prolifera JEL478]
MKKHLLRSSLSISPTIVSSMTSFLMRPFQGFSREEGKNIAFYIGGIMLGYTGELWTAAQSLNLVAQCVGSLLVGSIVKRFTTGRLAAICIIIFGFTILFMPILEGATGGSIPGNDAGLNGSSIRSTWGSWTPYLIYLFFTIAGVFHGGIELMRRVIPAEIVGGDAEKLRHMDSLVHIFYEVTGTIGALFSPYWM